MVAAVMAVTWLAAAARAEGPAPAPAPVTPAADAKALVAPLGVDALDQVGTLHFTFNVARGGVTKASRAWTWRPADNAVTLRDPPSAPPVAFTFGAPKTDAERDADSAFVNDSFWLAPQLHLRWAGSDVTVADHGAVALPIGEGTARQVTVTYPKQGGGYTPGDAYDLFLDDSGRIVAWNYREGNAPTPSMTTTFAGYVTAGPLTVATEHTTADGGFRLFFTDVAVDPR